MLSEPTRKLAVFQPPTRLTNGALATAKQQGPERRTGPSGNGPQCLTLLSEPTRKLAVFQPPTRLRNGALATAKQQGPEGRTEPPGNGSHCLTLLSEPTRKQALFQPSNLQKRALSGRHKHSKTAPSPVSKRTVLKDGPGLRATAPSQSSSNALPLLAAGVGGYNKYPCDSVCVCVCLCRATLPPIHQQLIR